MSPSLVGIKHGFRRSVKFPAGGRGPLRCGTEGGGGASPRGAGRGRGPGAAGGGGSGLRGQPGGQPRRWPAGGMRTPAAGGLVVGKGLGEVQTAHRIADRGERLGASMAEPEKRARGEIRG